MKQLVRELDKLAQAMENYNIDHEEFGKKVYRLLRMKRSVVPM